MAISPGCVIGFLAWAITVARPALPVNDGLFVALGVLSCLGALGVGAIGSRGVAAVASADPDAAGEGLPSATIARAAISQGLAIVATVIAISLVVQASSP